MQRHADSNGVPACSRHHQGGAISIVYQGQPDRGDIVLRYGSDASTAIAQSAAASARFTQLAAR